MRADLGPAFALHCAIASAIGLAATVIWGAAGGGYYWPVWVWLAQVVTVMGHAGLRLSLRLPSGGRRALGILGTLAAIDAVTEISVWGLSGGGLFWPAFGMLAFAGTLSVVALVTFRDRILGREPDPELVERVDELTRTRRGVVDAQAAELRRIERDLHDGAQARLVALSMQLGRAEERLADRPEEAALVREARFEASAAIAELRDLARGIAPPVLTDRGLGAAVEALGQRAAIPVAVHVAVDQRPPPVVESAAYFVVAEALTNVSKHAPGAEAQVSVVRHGDRLVVEVSDDGPGGADPEGAGLAGLRQRAEALDGAMAITSAAGSGTLVRVELPCGS
ncbi:MAG TPA: histidine kinase [Capillimicrobium sp.]|jgi:signal transduction histidine kinase